MVFDSPAISRPGASVISPGRACAFARARTRLLMRPLARTRMHSLLAPVLCCVLAAIKPAPAAANEGWSALPGAPEAGRLDDMHFVDPSTGWVVTSSGEIHHTTDAGASWALQLNTDRYFRSVQFVDATTGVAGTLGGQLLYRTTNAGADWLTIPNESIPMPRPEAVCGLAGSGDHLFGTGAYFGPAVFIKSTDRGASWTSRDMSAFARNLVDCYFWSADSGFAAGGSPLAPTSKPVILFTADGGTTWTTRHLGGVNGSYCWKIFFVDRLVGYVTVYDTGNASVLKTVDGGLTWTALPIVGLTSLEGIGFASPTQGWVDGWGGSARTLDGAKSWTVVPMVGNEETGMNRFQLFGPLSGYAVGFTVYKYDATISSAPAGALPSSLASTTSRFLLSSSPNPFDSETRIRFVLPSESFARVRLYDALGREMQTLLDETLSAGSHEVVWDGRGPLGHRAAPGVYLYRIDAGGFAESRRLTRLR